MTDQNSTTRIGRRAYLLGATAAAASLAGCSGDGGDGADSDGADSDGGDGGGDGGDDSSATPTVAVDGGVQEQVDGWLSDASNYDGGVVDRTDESDPTVTVGSRANGGNFGYSPPAIAVSPGTTVTWEWTGKGNQHNVVDDEGLYESRLVAEAGHTFSYTFESEVVSLYLCTPHRSFGMKGAVVVQGD